MAAIGTERPSSKLEAHKSNPNRREKIGGGLLSNIAKFAIDSTINYSFKAFPGRKQAHQIVREGLKDHPPLSASLDDKKKPEDLKLVMEEMHAKMEQMQEDTNIVKQQHKTSAEHVEGSGHPKKMPDEGVQDRHGPGKVKFWEDPNPMHPSKWKEEQRVEERPR